MSSATPAPFDNSRQASSSGRSATAPEVPILRAEVPPFSSVEVLSAEVRAEAMRAAAKSPPAVEQDRPSPGFVADLKDIALHAGRALVVMSLLFFVLAPVVRFLVMVVAVTASRS